MSRCVYFILFYIWGRIIFGAVLVFGVLHGPVVHKMEEFTVMWVLGAGADDFLPVLIYVVIHAKPPRLASNLEYIQRFRMASRMVSESSYFYTQLVCSRSSRHPATCPNSLLHIHSTAVITLSVCRAVGVSD